MGLRRMWALWRVWKGRSQLWGEYDGHNASELCGALHAFSEMLHMC